MSAARKELQEALCRYITDTLSYMDTVTGFCKGLNEWMIDKDDEKLHCFLDALEKLAVTSLHVFMENQVIHLSREISLLHVKVFITTARLICPLLLDPKRDAKARLQNVKLLSHQLDEYIQTTQRICDEFMNMNVKNVIDLDVDLSEEDTQRMLDHVNQLDEIRMNQAFRMVFLFKDEPCRGFIKEFSDRQPRMLQSLTELEETAVQLDSMNKGAKISSVVGSSVGAAGGVLSILGLVLTPFTAGASLALIGIGAGLGLTSGVNGIVTTATECGVNHTQERKANEAIQRFMEDVQTLHDCLEETMKTTVLEAIGKILEQTSKVGKDIYEFVETAKDVAKDVKVVRYVPSLAPDTGQVVFEGPLALTRSARAGLSALNALFVGVDVFFICKDSISLAKGTETETSRFIRDRVAMWRSEMDSWQKMHDLMNKGLLKSEKNRALLETPFYPEVEEKKQK